MIWTGYVSWLPPCLYLACFLSLLWLSRAKHIAFRMGFPLGISSRVNAERNLVLVDRLTLTPSRTLHLVRAHSRMYLLAVSTAGIAVLSESAIEEKNKP